MTVAVHPTHVLQEESISFSLYILCFFRVLFWNHTGEPGVLWILLEGQMFFTSSSSPVPYHQATPLEVHNKFLLVLLLKTYIFCTKGTVQNRAILNDGTEKHKVV